MDAFVYLILSGSMVREPQIVYVHAIPKAKKDVTESVLPFALANLVAHTQYCKINAFVRGLNGTVFRSSILAGGLDGFKERLQYHVGHMTTCK